jgi:iron-sulfur cluster repair protein YtfE (RIC family)
MSKSTQLHYDSNKDYDLIDVIRDYKLNFCRGNIIKYVARAGKKSDELQDLRKALDYLQREIAYLEDKQKEYIKQTIDR